LRQYTQDAAEYDGVVRGQRRAAHEAAAAAEPVDSFAYVSPSPRATDTLSLAKPPARVAGRGLHSYTFQLNLSRV
jgi:hypothetical protein